MIDTHTHLYLPEFGGEGEAVVDRAVAAGVEMMILPNVDLSTMGAVDAMHTLRPDVTRPAMGLHPTEVKTDYRCDLDAVMARLRAGKYCAVGEVGIDLYWDKTFEREQMLVFDEQLAAAADLNLPVIIHCRDGLDRAIEVLQGHKRVPAVFHSFGGSTEDVERILALGDHYYFGINGIVTFKNSILRSVVPAMPRNRIVLETDSPYLAPVPYRGRRNESSYLPSVLAAVAGALGLSAAEADAITSANARELFKL